MSVKIKARGSEQPSSFVVFASYQNMNDELREALVNRLETNKIPSKTDIVGNVKIPENLVTKAVSCCS
jgi:hypothetical protein